jgi:hypothetical protein
VTLEDSFGGAVDAAGVPVGVLFGLSTRDFRDPDLGVMLLLRKVDTGVDKSSRLEPTGVVRISERASLRDNGVAAVNGAAPATLGVNGVLLEVFADALRAGMSGRAAFCLSYGGILAFPLFTDKGVVSCRIIPL